MNANAPTLLSVSQASTQNADGTQSSMLVFGVVQATVTGDSPVVSFKLYRAADLASAVTAIGVTPISTVVLVTHLFDPTPLFGTLQYYVARAVDATGTEGAFSNIVSYAASSTVLGVAAGGLSPGAFGPYPILGSDLFLDPSTGEGVIGPNGDFLTVNSLECLAQDLRIRILTEFGELPMHQDFGFSKDSIIGSGQANRQAQAAILVADVKDMLRQEPRVYSIIAVTISQSDAYSWIIGYEIMAINVEDVLRFNMVYPYYA